MSKTVINAVGRELPEQIGSYKVKPFQGAAQMDCTAQGTVHSNRKLKNVRPGEKKLYTDLKEPSTRLKAFYTILANTETLPVLFFI